MVRISSTIWPAKGVLLAIALYATPRTLARLLAVAGGAGIVAKMLVGFSLLPAIAGTLSSVAGIALAVWLMQRLGNGSPIFATGGC